MFVVVLFCEASERWRVHQTCYQSNEASEVEKQMVNGDEVLATASVVAPQHLAGTPTMGKLVVACIVAAGHLLEGLSRLLIRVRSKTLEYTSVAPGISHLLSCSRS